jgi:hypothetical protein
MLLSKYDHISIVHKSDRKNSTLIVTNRERCNVITIPKIQPDGWLAAVFRGEMDNNHRDLNSTICRNEDSYRPG